MYLHQAFAQDVSDKVYVVNFDPDGSAHRQIFRQKFKTAAPQVWHAEQPLLSRSAFSNFSGALLLELIVCQRELRRIFN